MGFPAVAIGAEVDGASPELAKAGDIEVYVFDADG